MDIIDFFDHDILELPKNHAGDFEAFLAESFDKYLNCLSGLIGTDSVTTELKKHVPVVERLCSAIKKAVSAYLDGFPSTAFEQLESGLKAVKDPWLEELASLDDVSSALTYLYRVRCGLTSLSGRRDLFHIPFELRHLVSTQRYSIPGLPSLYLGGSLWVCWEELGRPSFESMYIARYRPAPSAKVKVLDLGSRPALFAGMINSNPKLLSLPKHASFFIAQGVCWPLTAACSIRVRNAGKPFVPEYIVPQLLLQWVRLTGDFDGIRYFSTKINQHLRDPSAAVNFVFPAKTKQPSGYCSTLCEKFVMSAPAAWSILSTAGYLGGARRPAPDWPVELIAGSPISYMKTMFWNCEDKLNELPCERVTA